MQISFFLFIVIFSFSTLNASSLDSFFAKTTGKRKVTEVSSFPESIIPFDLGLLKAFLYEFMFMDDPRSFLFNPASEFLCLLTRILYNIPSELAPWDESCASKLDLKWHMETFCVLFEGRFNEEILSDYFDFIMSRCRAAEENELIVSQRHLLRMSKLFIERLKPELLEGSLNFLRISMAEEALNLFLLHLNVKYHEKSQPSWRLIVMKLVQHFTDPELIYHSSLRFQVAETEKELFFNFLPILRTLLLRNLSDFLADMEAFETFVLFHTGDLEVALSIGFEGLAIMNEMFLVSEINFTAGHAKQKYLKKKKIERIFDAVFLSFDTESLVVCLYRGHAFSVFEAFLKYSQQSINMDEGTLLQIIKFLLIWMKVELFEDELYMSALIAYKTIPESVWNALKREFGCRPLQAYLLEKHELIQDAIEALAPKRSLNILSNEKIQFPSDFDGSSIDAIANELEYPLQLEVIRIFLARFCGIPLDVTFMNARLNESFEWSEAIAFMNFHVERWARLSGHVGPVCVFEMLQREEIKDPSILDRIVSSLFDKI